LAVLMVLLALPFVLFTPDYPLAPHDREPFSWRRLASSYWLSPREYPDFGWAWLTRFLTSLAIAMGTLYLLYFLRDAVHYAVLFGLGYGAYIAVDQALITQVLPAARDRAKDLGIINIAIVCPGAIGAVIAAPLVSLAGYPALFGATAVVAVAAAIGVWKIKSVS